MAIYKFIEHHNICYALPIKCEFFENNWLTIVNDIAIVRGSYKKGYAWNGCSPKFNFLDITWGTPDGRTVLETERPITYKASLIHDCLYQFRHKHGISRKNVDAIFLHELKKAGFKLAFVYWFAVRCFGWFYWNK